MKTLFISLILTAACLHHSVCAEKPSAPANRVFETPIEAAAAFIAAAKTGENAPLLEIFGTKDRDLFCPVVPELDRELRARFTKRVADCPRLRVHDDGTRTIGVGYGPWPIA